MGTSGLAWLVTVRDETWLRWIGRWRFATSEQVAAEFARRGESAPVKVVERRMRACRDLGLVTSQRVVAELPTAHSLTREGMNTVGLGGAVASPKVAEFRHDYQVIELARHLGVEKPDHELVTEREIRRVDTPNARRNEPPAFAVIAPETGSAFRRLYPDLATVTPSGAKWVHELEASRKDQRRLVRLMLAYVYAEHVRGARYYAVPEVRDRVQAAAAEANQRAAEVGRPQKISVIAWPATSPSPERQQHRKEGHDE